MSTDDTDLRAMVASAWYRWLYADQPLTAAADPTQTVPPQDGAARQAAVLAGARCARAHP